MTGPDAPNGLDISQVNFKILVDIQALDVEHKCRVGGDLRQRLAAVCEMGWDGDTALTANSDALNTDVPTLDHLALAESETERWSLLVGYR